MKDYGQSVLFVLIEIEFKFGWCTTTTAKNLGHVVTMEKKFLLLLMNLQFLGIVSLTCFWALLCVF